MNNNQPRKGICWLCSELSDLTEEHIPPHSAFNEHPLLLQAISRHSQETGVLTWERGRTYHRGLSVRSLCARCNNRAGRRFAPSYVRLVKTIAERVGEIQVQHRLTIQKIEKPALVLRQVIQQFVTANGPTFADANPWVRTFLQPERRENLPADIFVYLFATNKPCMRTSGISGHVYAESNRINVVSEFTFWPLGTVMSYGDLADKRLSPIQHWAGIPHTSNETKDLNLTVNAAASAYPVDFRDRDEIEKERAVQASASPTEALLLEMKRRVFEKGGKSSEDDFIFTAHRSQADKFRLNRK